MPELIEVEQYRSALEPVVGGTITDVSIPDAGFVRPKGAPTALFEQVLGSTLVGTRRHGKLLLLDLESDSLDDLVIGLRFGMTGRLLVNGQSPIESLEYASAKNDPAWDRATLTIGGATISMRDQRRLGSIELDPVTSRLGAEASTLTSHQLRAGIGRRTKAVKAVLLDQQLIAGLGNLLVDETLWRAGMAPARPVNTLSNQVIVNLSAEIRSTVRLLSKRGGSHTGDSFDLRHEAAMCPRDGSPMVHDTVGGRSTWWCPVHQHESDTLAR